ncbi:hypothetical protein OERS_41010 [Oerskovia enterophila]|uniref:Uncharacterized protein n=1 Tax=Oerskovia enterophila TaxID=43678 RepID=A0ABX2XY37_9CELL|nr:hypothetical protein OERS_41010 [Oerskovia enterophila]
MPGAVGTWNVVWNSRTMSLVDAGAWVVSVMPAPMRRRASERTYAPEYSISPVGHTTRAIPAPARKRVQFGQGSSVT